MTTLQTFIYLCECLCLTYYIVLSGETLKKMELWMLWLSGSFNLQFIQSFNEFRVSSTKAVRVRKVALVCLVHSLLLSPLYNADESSEVLLQCEKSNWVSVGCGEMTWFCLSLFLKETLLDFKNRETIKETLHYPCSLRINFP